MSSSSTSSETSARPRLRLGGSGEGFDSAIADRVRLYLKVTFFINAFLGVVATITELSGQGPPGTDGQRALFGIFATVAVNGMAWFLVARNRSGAANSPLVASATTLLLSAVYTYVVVSNTADPNPTRTSFFLLLIITAVLVLRSSLIPSRTTTTALVGVLAVAYPVYASRVHAVGQDRIFFVWMLAAGIVSVVVTVVTSSTVYGLNRKMRAAAQLGQYRLERLLGKGGMGEVYLAKHALLHRPTAIKLLRDVSASATRELFRQEVQTASGLTHPNTVEIYDYGRTPEGVFYFAMEYVEGATLEDVVLSTGAMPPSRVIHLLLQAAGSLGEAHDRGLVHRDVKPSNLMLCERGGIFDTLKVMDFGLVRDLADDKQAERGLMGTPLYLAPEAILEADGAVAQSDVYALGATAYFLLTGTPPFVGGSLVELLSDHLAAEPPAVVCDDPALAELVRRTLAKDPNDRPADAKELAAELEKCAHFGQWKQRDAAIWWAEHRGVVEAHRPSEESLGGGPSAIAPMGGSWRRSKTDSS